MSAEFHTLKVSNVKNETNDTVSLTFDISNELKDKFEYDHGQYLTLKTQINGPSRVPRGRMQVRPRLWDSPTAYASSDEPTV